MKFVQVPDDMQMATKALPMSRGEFEARNQIELHEPQKLQELAELQRVTDPMQRSVMTQMLLHNGSMDGMISVLKKNFPALQNVDEYTQQILVNLYRSNPSAEDRTALIQLMPLIGRLPEGARNHAVEQLIRMGDQGLQNAAQRLENSNVPFMDSFNYETGMDFARQIFGS